MFYPVIMMSTNTLDKTKHYPSSFTSSLLLLFICLLSVFLHVHPTVIGIRLRRGNASHFCAAKRRSVQALTFILSLLFRHLTMRQNDPGMLIDSLQTHRGTINYDYDL